MTRRLALELVSVETSTCLDAVSLHVAAGECVALLGPNGTGKSTLLRVAAGLVATRRGHRHVDAPIGYVPQDWRASFLPWLSARENALLAAGHGAKRDERARRLDDMLDEIGLDSRDVARTPRDLSGGQLQLLALVRALVVEPRMLLLDEAFSAIDASRRPAALALVDRAQRDGCGVLIATHDERDVSALADRALHLARLHAVSRSTAGAREPTR